MQWPRRARLDLTTPSLLGLPLAWLAVFFVVPIAIVAAYSFDVYSLIPGPHGFTLEAWRSFFHDPRVPEALLEVGEDVADRLGDHRRARLPARVLPRALRHEAQVRPPAVADRAVPDELPAAGARLEGDPRRPRRDQQLPLLDGPAVARPPALAAALQQVRGHARARLHLASVRRPADLRLAREPRPPTARGRDRPRREPAAGVPPRDAAALRCPASSRRSSSSSSRRSASSSRRRSSAERTATCTATRSSISSATGFPDWETGSVLAIFLLGVVAVADARLRALPPATTGGGGLMDVALSKSGARALRAFFALVVVFLYAPIVVLLDLLVQQLGVAVVPAQRLHAPLVPRVPRQLRSPGSAGDERDHRGALEPRRRPARRARLDRARPPPVQGQGGRPRRFCSARS